MRKLKILIYVVVIAVLLIPPIVQLSSHGMDYSRVTSILGSMILSYNTMTQEKFKETLIEKCWEYRIKVTDEDIEIKEDKNTNHVVINVHLDRKLNLLVTSIDRSMIVTKETTNLGM